MRDYLRLIGSRSRRATLAAFATSAVLGITTHTTHAQTPAQLDAVLDRVFTPLQALPFPKCGNDSWSSAIKALRTGLSANVNGWRSSANACGFQLHVEQIPASGIPSDAAVYLVLDRGLKLSDIPNIRGNKWRNIGDVQMNRPVLSLSTKERTLTTSDAAMPASFRAVFAGEPRYAGLKEFTVPIGPQLFTHAALSGSLGNTLKAALNAPIDNLWLRAGFASESVSDLLSQDGSKYMEILMPVGTILSGPLGIIEIRVTDATITVDDAKNVTLLGNIGFQSVPNKVFPAFADLPALPTGGINWTKAQVALSTPSNFTLEDFSRVGIAFNAQVGSGGMAGIGPAKTVISKIQSLAKPLAAFKMTNPSPNADSFRLRAGNSFPDLKQFNLVVLAKEAEAKDESGAKGPLVRVRGGLSTLGQKLADTNTDLSTSGLYTNTRVTLGVKLPRFGSINVGSASLNLRIDDSVQSIKLSGPFPPDRSLEFSFGAEGIYFNSPPSCASPIGISENISFTQGPDLGSLPAVDFDVGKIPGCAVRAVREVVKFVKNAFDKEPARDMYNCTNFRDEAFAKAYPPGRLWGARDEYTRNASSGAWARYMFSERTQKFHPFGAKAALGGTACGGLVGEKGVGLGRLDTPDDSIWNLAVMCETIPPDLKGAPVNTPTDCYGFRDMLAPRPALAGKFVQAAGDTSKTTLFVSSDGVARKIGGGNDWRVWGECGLSTEMYPPTVISLHEIYGIAMAPPISSATECRQVMGGYWKAHPRMGKIIAYLDNYKNTYVVDKWNRKRFIGNKDNWTVFNACYLKNEDLIGVSAAEVASIPEGAAITSAADCRTAIGEAGGRVPTPPPPPAPPPAPAPYVHPRAGQLIIYGDSFRNVNLVTRDGKKRWIGNKDKWSVFNDCGLTEKDLTYLSAREVDSIPGGPNITGGSECRAAIAEARRR